jgi:predicted membrane protein
MEAGAAEFHVSDIANANCRRVRFQGGVGEVTLDFSGEWRQSMDADVDVSNGSLNLRLPRDVGVVIRLSRFLASFESAGFVKRGRAYYSSNYESARHRLTLDINATIGGVDVAWVNR